MAGRTLTAALAALALVGTGLAPGSTAVAGGGSYHAGYGAHFGHGRHGYGHIGYRHHFGGHHYRHRHHGGHGATNALLGVTAGLLFLDVVSRAHRRYDDYDAAPRRVYRVAEPPRYAPPPQQTASANCLQTREYQTTIVVGGEEKEGYGTACLQPDGSWLMGPPKLVPEYD
ncbi:MAG: hypothetical protein ACE5ED_04905 [Rhodothalassiaceae bacterium]